MMALMMVWRAGAASGGGGRGGGAIASAPRQPNKVRVVLRGFFGVFLWSNYFSSMYYKLLVHSAAVQVRLLYSYSRMYK